MLITTSLKRGLDKFRKHLRSSAYFSIIQYCPSLARQEAVNIGILLFSPKHNYLRVKFTQDNSRVERLFKNQDSYLDVMKNEFTSRLWREFPEPKNVSMKDIELFQNRLANRIQATPLIAYSCHLKNKVPFSTLNIGHLDYFLNELFDNLVAPPKSET